MDKSRRTRIYDRVKLEFNVTQFHRYFYCAGINYFRLQEKLYEHYPACQLYFRVDHVVVKKDNGEIIIYLLCSHSSGRCAEFLHD